MKLLAEEFSEEAPSRPRIRTSPRAEWIRVCRGDSGKEDLYPEVESVLRAVTRDCGNSDEKKVYQAARAGWIRACRGDSRKEKLYPKVAAVLAVILERSR